MVLTGKASSHLGPVLNSISDTLKRLVCELEERYHPRGFGSWSTPRSTDGHSLVLLVLIFPPRGVSAVLYLMNFKAELVLQL